MNNMIFLCVTALFLTLAFNWGFRNLTGERWQVLASVPTARNEDGSWKCLTFTYYGFFSACSYAFALMMFSVLTGSLGLPPYTLLLYIFPVLLVCVPASRIVAALVEGKSTTFTVGGAAFVGVLTGPWITLAVSSLSNELLGWQVNSTAIIAAMALAYAFGESLGRLACLSFGCCYGKRLEDCGPLTRKMFSNMCFVFNGMNKKAAYESGLEGQKLVPIQAVTSLVFASAGLICTWLFLEGLFKLSAALCLVSTQGWRLLSEFLRADDRGGGRISAYQVMGVIGMIYCCLVIPIMPGAASTDLPDVLRGVGALGSLELVLSLQAVWIIIFVYTGKSKVLGSSVNFAVSRK